MNSIILKPYRISEIDLDKIIYAEIKEGKNKKVIYLNYDSDSNDHLSFQTTSLLNIESLKKKDGFYELDIPLYGANTQKVSQLNDFLRALDKKIINDARKNSKKWFNGMKNITYKSVIRSSTNKSKEYVNGVLRIKITENSNTAPILIDGKGKNINVNDIKPNSNIKMILECYAIWITDSGFGLYLKPVLMSFIEKKKIIRYEYQLLDDTEEENEQIEDVMDTEVNPTSQSAFIQDVIDKLSEDETSQIELPENLKIIKNTCVEKVNTCVEKVNTCVEKVNTCVEKVNTSVEEVNISVEEVNTYSEKKNPVYELSLPIKEISLPIKEISFPKKDSSETSDYNTDDNIQTYKNYSSEVNKILNHELEAFDDNINNLNNDTSSESLNNDLTDINVISKNMLNQITESDINKISLIDSDLNDSSSNEDLKKLKNIIKTNI